MNTAAMRAGSCGHLFLIATGAAILAIDTAVAEGGTPRLVWKQDFEEQSRPIADLRRGRIQLIGVPGGFAHLPSFQGDVATGIMPTAISERLICTSGFIASMG